jgi:hypothetical protein
MQRTEPEFEQAQTFEVGVRVPHPPKNSSPLDFHSPLAKYLQIPEPLLGCPREPPMRLLVGYSLP